MAPTPAAVIVEESTKKMRPQPGEEVVISGMSGIFPKSDSVKQFGENLYNKVDMVSTENPRWTYNHPEVPKHMGQVNGMGKFDAQFFRVHYKQAATMEPMSRKLLEHAYSAIYDSGINPPQLRGKKVGVFIGSTFSESEKIVLYENIQHNGFGITGCNKAMYANRISYWIDGKGPSYSLDLACASSTACIEHAYRSISSGQCDAAIVGGCNLCMHPNVSLHIRRAGFSSLDGKTRCFDKNGDGYVRSDAISVLFLQRAKDAKRIYTEVYHAKANYSPQSELLRPIRQPKEIREFLEAFYSEIDISPEDVEYVEANGAALVEADTNELQVIGSVFAKNGSVKIGCVKSNMGSSEPASGVCGLTKACLAYHSGKLPGNLNYENPLDIPEINNGKIEVLTDNTTFNRGFTALNTFSYSGANVHVLLKGHYKPKDLSLYKSSFPHLVLVSGRQDNCVQNMLTTLKKNSIDAEQIGLIHNIHKYDIPGHMTRGYTILDTNKQNETVCLSQSIEYNDGITHPVWFVYSGMGSQWAGMGAELMRIPIFAAAIEKCHKVLEPKGIDIFRILTDPDKTIYDNILHSFVGIAAVQIGLTDILRELGIVPNNIIGHSVGELGCAYADGCFTAEEMILSAYCRGLVSIQTPFIRGSMAAIGLGYKAILPLCPPEIEVACHNSEDSSTISGPADVMKQFVAELTSKGIFAKEVPCSNIAYHSRYIADAGPELLKYLNEVIKVPKLRSKKWISTSVPEDKWKSPSAQFSSAEYHTNNLLNSVLFEETSKFIPNGALVIEIAPHGLLQAILKRSLTECIHVPMTRRGGSDPIKFLLESFGKLYQSGLNPKVDILYPKIEYPVSTETPLLSHYVEWEHNEDWVQAKYNSKDRVIAMDRDFVMSFHDDDFKYFKGYVRDGNYIFPEAAFLFIVWETFAMYKGVNYKDLSVTFKDVNFHSDIIINTEIPVKLEIVIHKGYTIFEVIYKDSPIVTGSIAEKTSGNNQRDLRQHVDKDGVTLSSNDIYTIMRLRGYTYKDEFRSIYSSNTIQTEGSLKWDENWITFLDAVLQFNAFAKNYDGVSTPSLIKYLSIDVKKHLTSDITKIGDVPCLNAEIYKLHDYTRCGGVELEGLIFKNVHIGDKNPNVLLDRQFVPHFSRLTEMKTALQTNLQIVADNINNKIVNTTVLISNGAFSSLIQDVTSTIPYVEFDFKQKADENTKLIIVENLLGDEKKIETKAFPKNAFILTLENDAIKIESKTEKLSVITIMNIQNQAIVLLKKLDEQQDLNITYLPIVEDRKFSWISRLQVELTRSNKVVLVSERQPIGGLFGMVKKLREEYGDKVGLVLVDDFTAPSFNPENAIYKKQLQKGLSINILFNGQWGGYYYISNSKTAKVQSVQLTTTMSESDGLSWVEKISVPETNMQVQVYYAGPSFKDAQNVFLKTNKKNAYGMDFSGITKSGQKVMGLISGGALASTVEADPDLLWPVPEHWSLEDAATVPLAYVHAYYCLVIRSQLSRGKTVFVNGGAGALGQAVISVSLALDCTIYTTVSDLKKKEFLLKMFPQLDEKNIKSYSDALFQDSIRTQTNDEDIYVVINCASGEFRKSAMKCVGDCSLFLDLNEHDMESNEVFGMGYLQLLRNYSSVRLDNLFRPEFAADKKLIQKMISDGIAQGIVRPLSRIIYSPVNVTRAFRLLSLSKHRGRVLIKMRNIDTLGKDLDVASRISYSSKGTYVVVCDETAVGMELADRLVKHGARNMIINIKPNSIAGYCYTKFLTWSKFNVSVQFSYENLQTEKSCVALLKEGAKLGPILGIFIVQNSNTAETFDSENVVVKFNNTACVVANLDMASRNFCNELDYFAVLNHSMGNLSGEYMASVTDKICHVRNSINLPALVQRLGLLKEINEIESFDAKMQPQSIYTAFNALETSLKRKYTNVISYNLKEDAASKFLSKIAKIIGVKDINELDEKLYLKNFFHNEVLIEEVNEAIIDAYRISYPAEKIQEMTIESLKKLSQDVFKINNDFHTGLGAFFKYIDQDECAAAEPIVTMATNYSKVKDEDELDPKATYLLLIPGFGGHHEVFTPVAERLKVQAMTFQYGPELTNADVPEMAAYIMKFMKKRLEIKSKFYLLGYSFGVNVALELAALFEKEGVKDINELDEKLYLKNFFHNEVLIEEVNEAIIDAYRISYPAEKIQEMTIESLKKLSQDVFKINNDFHTGLGAFFKYIDQDECAAAEPIVTMATNYSKVKDEDELDPKATYLLLIPGFGGHHEVFTPVAERLKVQAMTFQYGPELTNADVPEMAAYIMKFMKKRLEIKSKFYLLGYSFGVNVALELAALFEKEGHIGIVYCLDSSPDALRVQLDAYVGHLTDSELQNRLVQHMYKLMSGCDSEDLIEELEKKESWSEKIELCVHKLRGLVKYSHQYKRCLLEGVKDINELDEKLYLKNFFHNEVLIEEVNEAIIDAYRISYPAEKIQEMTIESLKKLSQDVFKINNDFHTGLGAFFKYIDQDECAAAEPIVTMATNYSKVKDEDELDPKATYLLLIPGFGGHHEVFTPVAERLKVQAMTFQYGPELTNADVPEMAAYIMKFMKKRLEIKSKFYLLGYSFGVNVALELAALFEKEGHIGIVYCLDSSPDALRVQLDAYVGHLTDSELQNRLVQHMYKLMSGCDSEDLIEELEKKESWSEKIELCVHKLRGLVKYSHQYKRCLLEGTYKRIMLARNYEPTFKLKSELVLMKGIPHPNAEKLPDDYNLSKYTTMPVKIFDIESDHSSAPQDCRVANIVNSLLEPTLLEAFKNKNLLWTYLRVPIKSW